MKRQALYIQNVIGISICLAFDIQLKIRVLLRKLIAIFKMQAGNDLTYIIYSEYFS